MLVLGGAMLVLALLSSGAIARAGAADTLAPDSSPWGPPALAPLAVAGPTETITVGLVVSHAATELPTFALRGRRAGAGDSRFRVGANVNRTPCPGEYRFEAAQENLSNGNSATYSALIRLTDPDAEPPRARCGTRPPDRRGRIHITVAVRGTTLFELHASRRRSKAFKGRLAFLSFLECDRPYRLRTGLDLAGWNRSITYRLHVLEVNARIQGREITDERC